MSCPKKVWPVMNYKWRIRLTGFVKNVPRKDMITGNQQCDCT